MQDVDRISNVEALSQPAGHRGSRVNVEPLCVVPRQQRVDGSLLDPVPLLVERAVVTPT